MTQQATVHVVDDDPAVRQSLQWLIESVDLTVRTYANAQEFLDRYDHLLPACVVVDVRMPGVSGLDLQEKLAVDGISVPLIFITAHADVPMAVRALKSGAADFIEKPFNDQELLECIQRAIDQSTHTRERQEKAAEIRRCMASLTERERQVMDEVVAGHPNKAIARNLKLSSKTVEWHRSNVMSKMKAESLPELVKFQLYFEWSRENPRGI